MKNILKVSVFSIMLFTSLILINGCASTDEAMIEAEAARVAELDLLKQKNDALSKENSQLRQQITRLEQDIRNLTAKTAELETKLAAEKEKAKIPTPPPKPVITNPEMEYRDALSLFKQKKYQESADKLQVLINAGVRETLEDNCYYWIGENNFGMKNYQTAITYFEKIFNYKITEKKDDAAIMIANSYWEIGNKKEAVKYYNEFLEKYPASPYARVAKGRISK